MKQCKPLSWLREARDCTWAALINLLEGMVVRAVYKLHRARLLSPHAQAGSNGEGDWTVCCQTVVLSQPWGRRGDFQLPVLLALTLSGSQLSSATGMGSRCQDILGCRGGRSGVIRV